MKQVLVGSILAVSASDLPKFAIVYGAVGAFHWLARRPLLAASEAADGEARHSLLWDFLFYLSFSVVVTSSVATAGVLLVFCFLIIPAIIGSLFTRRIAGALGIGWLGGVAASAFGLAASFELDLPTGAAMVIAFAFTLVLGAALRALLLRSAEERRIHLRVFFRAVSASVLVIVSLAVFWLMIMPLADQPVLDLLQSATGIGPEPFLTVEEREAYGGALNDAHYRQWQVTQLSLSERQSRWQGEELSDTAVRRIGSFQQTFNEMLRGEDFVLKSLSGRARQRERWYIGPPLLIIAMIGLFALLPDKWRVGLVQSSSTLCLRLTWALRSPSRACFPRR